MNKSLNGKCQMVSNLGWICAAIFLAGTWCLSARQSGEEIIDASRVARIAGWLSPQPAGFAWPVTNRTAWDLVAKKPAFDATKSKAEKLLAEPLPDVPDSLYLEYSRDGNRTHWQDAEFKRRGRIASLTLAEAMENRGRFLPALEKTIIALCAEKTWLYPAHDGNLANFHGASIDPELGATGLAAELAEADYILGDKLSPATRQLIRDNVNRRVLEPFKDMVQGRRKEAWWLRAKMNWNAVCVANTVFAALALAPSRDERAWFAAAGEHFIHYSLEGFTPDGYCAEGIGYWNYGFGHDVLMIETLRRATDGKIDLLRENAAIQPALFCVRAEIFPGIYPSISDCAPGTRPNAGLRAYVSQRLGLVHDQKDATPVADDLCLTAMLISLEPNLPAIQLNSEAIVSSLRSFFPFGGVLISRTASDAHPPFAVVFKGGNNDEPHNHDDVGSFSVVVGTNMVICDPGGEVYTKRTFGPHRYDSQVLNSFGHAVPVIAGQLQRTGREAQAVILETNFSDAQDVLKFDLRSAYAVPQLEKLERTFVFQRKPKTSLLMTDVVRFSKPEPFETALITWGEIKQLDANTLELVDGKSSVRVEIDTGGRRFHLRQETIDEDVHTPRKPVHLGIVLDQNVKEATVRLRMSPGDNDN